MRRFVSMHIDGDRPVHVAIHGSLIQAKEYAQRLYCVGMQPEDARLVHLEWEDRSSSSDVPTFCCQNPGDNGPMWIVEVPNE